MQKYNLDCPECEASFTVLHDMDSKSYGIGYCPFCGEGINCEDDNEDENYDEDWEEDE